MSATAEEIRNRLDRGEDRTDWAKVDAMSQEEVERLADEEEGPLPEGWENTVVEGSPAGVWDDVFSSPGIDLPPREQPEWPLPKTFPSS